eukprot:g38212.t1
MSEVLGNSLLSRELSSRLPPSPDRPLSLQGNPWSVSGGTLADLACPRFKMKAGYTTMHPLQALPAYQTSAGVCFILCKSCDMPLLERHDTISLAVLQY